MSVIPDQDLAFLSSVSNEDLDIIFNLLVYDSDNKKRITQELLNTKLVKKHYPDHKQYINNIIKEIQKYGANSIVSVLRLGKGVLYYEILNDVCNKMKIKYPKGGKTEEIESYLLKYTEKKFKDYLDKLSIKEKQEFLKKMNISDKEYVKLFSGGLFTTSASIAVAVRLAEGLGCLGILGGLSIMAYSVVNAFGPAYRVTGPICITIAMLRRKYDNKISEGSPKKKNIDINICMGL